MALRLLFFHAGFSSHEKLAIEHWAAKLGARYSGSLVCGETSHLVVRSLVDAFASAKYERAKAWGVHVVSYFW